MAKPEVLKPSQKEKENKEDQININKIKVKWHKNPESLDEFTKASPWYHLARRIKWPIGVNWSEGSSRLCKENVVGPHVGN